MNGKLRDAIDRLEEKIENGELVDYTDSKELSLILEAAYRYWDLQDEDYDD